MADAHPVDAATPQGGPPPGLLVALTALALARVPRALQFGVSLKLRPSSARRRARRFQNESWRGWWGETPPYHVPVFVLTHHARPPLRTNGGTTFHFATGGIHEALARAREAANGKDVRVGGGVSTIRQYLREGFIDELHLALSPVLLGRGEALFEGMDWRALGYRCVERVAGEKAIHVVLAKGV